MASIPEIVQGTRAASGLSRWIAPLCAAVLGLALVYLAGFARAEALHDGAHDSRHSASFPCH
jgi:cobalt transporter subunit CbtB